jgi:hypothetical protein
MEIFVLPDARQDLENDQPTRFIQLNAPGRV